MSEKELKKWTNKMNLFWGLHGGMKNWGSGDYKVNPCHRCPHENCKWVKKKGWLKFNPKSRTIFVGKWDGQSDCWCGEWIKHV